MTYQTKAALRQELATAKAQAELTNKRWNERWDKITEHFTRVNRERQRGAHTLRGLGFTERRDLVPIDPGEIPGHTALTDWEPPYGFVATSKSALEADREELIKRTRHETLAAVIDALEIQGYARPTTSLALQRLIDAGERPGTTAHLDRFWSDIQTALDVRAERKRDEERKATEARVSELRDRPFAERFTLDGETIARAAAISLNAVLGRAPKVDTASCDNPDCDCQSTEDIENNVTAVRLADSVRPEKDPQGLTRRLDGKPDKKSKKEKAA